MARFLTERDAQALQTATKRLRGDRYAGEYAQECRNQLRDATDLAAHCSRSVLNSGDCSDYCVSPHVCTQWIQALLEEVQSAVQGGSILLWPRGRAARVLAGDRPLAFPIDRVELKFLVELTPAAPRTGGIADAYRPAATVRYRLGAKDGAASGVWEAAATAEAPFQTLTPSMVGTTVCRSLAAFIGTDLEVYTADRGFLTMALRTGEEEDEEDEAIDQHKTGSNFLRPQPSFEVVDAEGWPIRSWTGFAWTASEVAGQGRLSVRSRHQRWARRAESLGCFTPWGSVGW